MRKVLVRNSLMKLKGGVEMKGKVILVGAGPGDIGLLTLKGIEAIKQADVVIYDRLVGEEILKLIPKQAEIINAGKRSSDHKIPQCEINKILLEKALEGKNVLRLKGGDPFLFGRGGEELELLKEYSVDFEVIPGITSALAVPAYAGIPVTHRNFASSVHIVTGHRKNNEPADIDFKSCVLWGGTLVFLMSLSNIEYIADGLISNGMRKETLCAVIENGTRPKQRKIIASVSEISDLCKKENVKSPAVIVVGDVCSLSDDFDWFDNLPLKGKSVVVTRPEDRSGEISEMFRNLGAEVIEYPCVRTISLIDEALFDDISKKIKTYDVIVFTSPAGVKFVFEELFKRKMDGRFFFGKKIAVIGSATGDELKKYGLFYDFMPKVYNGKNLGKTLILQGEIGKVLLLRAREASNDIIDELKKGDIEFNDTAVYYTEYVNDKSFELEDKIINGEIDYVTFTSASTVKAFVSSIHRGYDKFTGVCIGEKTNDEAIKYGIRTIVSENAVIADMVSAVVSEVRGRE